MTVGSLFSGIGGLELGLDMCGVGPVLWQAECDPCALAVLEHHWPTVKRYTDVRDIDAATAERPDIICGGFPCQDISDAGTKAGLAGARSGLWFEFARVLRDLRPRFAFIENVDALVNRGLDRVLGDLAALGFDAEWAVLGACAAGAPHTRERMFILAHADRDGLQAWERGSDGGPWWTQVASEQVRANAEPGRRWLPEPDVRRVVNGLPRPVEQTRCLGNAVVPAQAALAFSTLAARLIRQKEAA